MVISFFFTYNYRGQYFHNVHHSNMVHVYHNSLNLDRIIFHPNFFDKYIEMVKHNIRVDTLLLLLSIWKMKTRKRNNQSINYYISGFSTRKKTALLSNEEDAYTDKTHHSIQNKTTCQMYVFISNHNRWICCCPNTIDSFIHSNWIDSLLWP